MYTQTYTKHLFLQLSKDFSAEFIGGSKVSAEKLDS